MTAQLSLKTTLAAIDEVEYARVTAALLNVFQNCAADVQAEVVPTFLGQSSFGHIEILLSHEHVHEAGGIDLLKQIAFEEFHATTLRIVGESLRFDFRFSPEPGEPGFPVMLTRVRQFEFGFKLDYLSYGGAGGLIARAAVPAGLLHRPDGLWFCVLDGTQVFGKIRLTRSTHKALTFLGYNLKRFEEGFASPEALYRFIAESRYFTLDAFSAGAKSEQPDEGLAGFLRWCRAQPALPCSPYPQDAQTWLARIADAFPDFTSELKSALVSLARRRQFKDKFNLGYVSEVTGLTGKPLALRMKRFQELFKDETHQQDFVLGSPESELRRALLELPNR